MMSEEINYQQRLILFIDFLGFRDIVATTKSDPVALRKLLAAMDAAGEIGNGEIYESQRITQFSDSIVLSYDVTEPSGVFWLLNAVALTVITLTGRGYLLRGAVTIGDLYHTERHIVGPAMVQAYEMESKIANYPRVIVDPKVLSIARRHRSNIHSADEEEAYVRRFLETDADGWLYFDYVSWESVVHVTGGEDDLYPLYLAQISQLLNHGLKHHDPKVTEKYLWLHRHYVAALNTFNQLPPEHPYRLESPENCEAIEALPRHDALATSISEKGK